LFFGYAAPHPKDGVRHNNGEATFDEEEIVAAFKKNEKESSKKKYRNRS